MTESSTEPTRASGDRSEVSTSDELPFIDAHTIEVNATAERAWDQAARNVLPRFGGGTGQLGRGARGRVGARMLGCPYRETRFTPDGIPETIVGFHIAQARHPNLIVLAGQHRYARYTLTLHIEPAPGGRATRITATTRAAFPGSAGHLYKRIVIDTGGHIIAVRRLLSAIRTQAQRG